MSPDPILLGVLCRRPGLSFLPDIGMEASHCATPSEVCVIQKWVLTWGMQISSLLPLRSAGLHVEGL